MARRTTEPAPSAPISGASGCWYSSPRDLVEHDQLVTREIERARGLQEPRLDAMDALGMVEQRAVEARARDGIDHLVRPLPIRRERRLAVRGMQHASAHRDQQRLDGVEHARRAQGVDAPLGERQVDGAARVHVDLAQVGAALEHDHLAAGPCQVDRHQGAGETRAQDGDGPLHVLDSPCSSAWRASTQRHTSSKLL